MKIKKQQLEFACVVEKPEREMGSCKISTLKTIRIIAFVDLIIAVIFSVYRGINLSSLLSKISTNDRGTSPSSTRLADQIGKSNHSQSDGDHSLNATGTYMRYWSVVYLTAIVMTFAVEVFLFLLLNSGAPMRNQRHCKHWFLMRAFLLIFSVAGSVIDVILGEYKLISGVLELEKLYRLGTLAVMWRFMDEIKAGDFDNSKLNFGTEAGSSNVFGSFSNAQ